MVNPQFVVRADAELCDRQLAEARDDAGGEEKQNSSILAQGTLHKRIGNVVHHGLTQALAFLVGATIAFGSEMSGRLPRFRKTY